MLSNFRGIHLAWAAACLAVLGAAAAPTSALAQVAAPSEAQLRLDEMQVEIAWDADPLTFPYQLVAACEGPVLKLYGTVPNNVVAAQALKTAREHTTLNVIDHVQVHSDMLARPVPDSPDSLRNAAGRTIQEAFPAQAGDLTVTADRTGRITVAGRLPSCEERRTLSRRLKQIRGCTAVVNQVQVPPVEVQGHVCMRVTADGGLLLAAPGKTPTGAGTAPQLPATAAQNAAPAVGGPTAPLIKHAELVRTSYTPPQPAFPAVGPNAPTPPTAPGAPVSPATLKRAVERAAGMAAREVQVAPAPSGGLVVHFKVRSEQDGQQLIEKLIKLPDLAPYQVRFFAEVER